MTLPQDGSITDGFAVDVKTDEVQFQWKSKNIRIAHHTLSKKQTTGKNVKFSMRTKLPFKYMDIHSSSTSPLSN